MHSLNTAKLNREGKVSWIGSLLTARLEVNEVKSIRGQEVLILVPEGPPFSPMDQPQTLEHSVLRESPRQNVVSEWYPCCLGDFLYEAD